MTEGIQYVYTAVGAERRVVLLIRYYDERRLSFELKKDFDIVSRNYCIPINQNQVTKDQEIQNLTSGHSERERRIDRKQDYLNTGYLASIN